jgi:hypothetical protein
MSDYCSCDGDPADIYKERIIKARKIHTCSECGNDIERGDEYTQVKYLYDGEWTLEKWCEYCRHDYKILIGMGMCPYLGDLEDAWKSAFGKGATNA